MYDVDEDSIDELNEWIIVLGGNEEVIEVNSMKSVKKNPKVKLKIFNFMGKDLLEDVLAMTFQEYVR